MKYFPKSRIIENQKANPGKFSNSKGDDYTGPYYTTFDGKTFTGANPAKGFSNPIIPYILPDFTNSNEFIAEDYKQIAKNPPNYSLLDPTPFTPKPTSQNYLEGKITRYIARQKGGTQFKVMEIDKTTFDDMTKQRGEINHSVWRAISIQWQISGPLNDELVNGIKVRPGIIDTNQKILDQAEKNFIGIKQYLNNLTQFSIVN